MADTDYYLDTEFGMWWRPENPIRTGPEGKDTTNLAAATFYRMPGRLLNQPIIYIKKKKVFQRVANVKYWGYLGHHGFHQGKFSADFDFIDMSLLKYLTKAVTETGPVSGIYTRTYATTTAQGSPAPTIQILLKYQNRADAGNNIMILLTGVAVRSMALIGSNDQEDLKLTHEFRFANAIQGTLLDTEPGFGTLKTHTFDQTEIDYTKGGTPYPGAVNGFQIIYDDGTMLHKSANQLKAEEAINGNPDIRVSLDFAPKSEDHFDDTTSAPLEPETDSDVDITIKPHRDETGGSEDWVQFAFEKLWNTEDEGDFAFVLDTINALQHSSEFIFKPAEYEAGGKLTITEKSAVSIP